MGTTIFTTDKTRESVIAHMFAPLEIVATSFGDTSAVAAVRIPLTDENTENFRRVYDFGDTDQSVIVAIVIKHEGSLNGMGRRNVSWKEISEDMNPYYSGGATKSLLDKLTPLLPCPDSVNSGALPLHWAHDWRTVARAAQ